MELETGPYRIVLRSGLQPFEERALQRRMEVLQEIAQALNIEIVDMRETPKQECDQ